MSYKVIILFSFSASRDIKKEILETPKDEYDSYENLIDNDIDNERSTETDVVQNQGRIIVQCLETVNDVKDMEDDLEKDLIMRGISVFKQ